jgi:hypothetical protein
LNAAGSGACGVVFNSTDLVVSLNSAQYDNGANCFKTVSITANGVTVQARVLDEVRGKTAQTPRMFADILQCPGCQYAGLDLSPSLFQEFAPLDLGETIGSWYF